MGDGHVIADQQREAIGVERPGMGDVQHAAVLDTGARADADAVHIAADHRQWPYRAVGANLDIPQDHGAAVDECALAQAG
ncbi:hypothetical protein D3C76_1753820 [compost metagenome]